MRQSTDMIGADDPDVFAAVEFMQDNLSDSSIGVKDIARQAGVSKRVLEQRFKEHLGSGPWHVLLNLRLQKVKRLLAESDMLMKDISERSGFSNYQHMNRAFLREAGMSPRDYRKKHKREIGPIC